MMRRHNRRPPPDHWAFALASELIARGPRAGAAFRLQSSISPSGTIHIGNFRDTVVVWAVREALALKGVTARFVLCLDDADVLKNPTVPASERGKPLCYVTVDGASFGDTNTGAYLRELSQVGCEPDEVTRQSRLYFDERRYDRIMTRLLRRTRRLRAILSRYRDRELPANWTPLQVYCSGCYRLVPEVRRDGWFLTRYSYHCECGLDVQRKLLGGLPLKKLSWRLDWPMRSYVDRLDFEPCGPDHAAYGSTMTTSAAILREVLGAAEPLTPMYGFVLLRGATRKISSSAGDRVNLATMLSLFPRELVLWRYLKARLRSPMCIDLGEGFLRLHAEFRRFLARVADGASLPRERRICELLGLDPAAVTVPPRMRPLVAAAQGLGGREAPAAGDEDYLGYARRWLETYAPASFVFDLKRGIPQAVHDPALSARCEALLAGGSPALSREDFRVIYLCLFGREDGPPLRALIRRVGAAKVGAVLRQGLGLAQGITA